MPRRSIPLKSALNSPRSAIGAETTTARTQSASVSCASVGARTSPIGVRASAKVTVAPTNASALGQNKGGIEVASRFDEVSGDDRRK